jgi:CDP-paratose 2-epimerase
MIFASRQPVLVTGGAGFIATNLADRLLSAGQPVLLFDNLSRRGVRRNLEWLSARHGRRMELVLADVREAGKVRRAVARASAVFHLAAQVAVTRSLADPVTDFEINAGGTLNVLEALRNLASPPPLLFTSTNKVYGTLGDIAVGLRGGRYAPDDPELDRSGISERQPLDFHSPYGCSKGAAEQYVLDYARIYGLPALVFRMSCIYGPHQQGSEDQGWVAHFLLRALHGQPITIYGDGRQVRDALYVDDLVDAMLTAMAQLEAVRGRAFNIGGGPGNLLSLLDLMSLVRELEGACPPVRFSGWRPADQRYYVSDCRRFAALTGWRPGVGVAEGVRRLYQHLRETEPPVEAVQGEPAVAHTAS